MSGRTMEQGVLDGFELVKAIPTQREQWRITDDRILAIRAANLCLREELDAATRRISAGSSRAPALPTLGEDFVAKQGANTQKLGGKSVGAEALK